MAAWPVDPEALRALWREGLDQPLVVGVSGGGDSLALVALLRRAAPDRPLVAVIIDHAVQEGSAATAAEAAARAEALGARAEVRRLRWAGRAPKDQASARAGRYRALAEAARALGATTIAVAHTLDDQAETALIKWGRSGRWGEAGMRRLSPCPVWPEGLGLRLARPLLGVRRKALRAWGQGQGLIWHEDPANANPAYARGRARAILSADEGLTERLAAHATRARDAHARRQAQALAWVSSRARFEDTDGFVALDRLPEDRAGLRGLAALIGAVAGQPFAAGPEGVGQLVRALRAGSRAQTLGGAMVRRRGAGFVMGRDPGALLGRSGVAPQPPVSLAPGETVLVDGRLLLTARKPGYEAAVTPRARWALRRYGHWIALNGNDDVTVRWLTAALVRHILAPMEPIACCDPFEGVQQALGLLS